MLTNDEKLKMWESVCLEFPHDEMMRDIHFVRELIAALRKKEPHRSYAELGDEVEKEMAEWSPPEPAAAHPK